MALISYDDTDAAAFAATRELPHSGLHRWRHAVQQHLRPRTGTTVLDLGAGTGAWAAAFTDWYGVRVVGVEPSAAMRSRASHRPLLAGDALGLPLRDSTMDAAWLSTMIHHIPDLDAAAHELRRVLRPGAPVLVRSPFPGRHRRISLFKWFPEAVRVLDRYPDVARVRSAFAAAGFPVSTIEAVAQTSAPSLAEAAAHLDRRAHTLLQLITDDEYDAGLARLRTAARDDSGPVVDHLDLLVLR
ncbi:class I SAM-dependent methyltransferase [Micromonospora krabiensis]|uniref:class I SAM-dependent methyltransferase n=1 Tax=Micromonospora krabiensis TaxID=307121 RepID=UPI000B850446|nr:methyltransferase domain-containing protein [Micromonospora krabiensis]